MNEAISQESVREIKIGYESEIIELIFGFKLGESHNLC